MSGVSARYLPRPSDPPPPETAPRMSMPVLIRATHHYGFRSGEWARVVAVVWMNDRPCYHVHFIDGVTDTWPINDPSDPYEFRQGGR